MKINWKKYLGCSFFIHIFLISSLFANQIPSQNDIAEVNRLVEKKKFSEAIDIYSDWVALGFKSKWIFYNLSLLHENMGNIGYAMFYLKKAEKIAPDDALINKRIIILQNIHTGKSPQNIIIATWRVKLCHIQILHYNKLDHNYTTFEYNIFAHSFLLTDQRLVKNNMTKVIFKRSA